MAALNSVENSSQYEKCRERECQPVHHEVLHEVRNVSLKVRHPPGSDAATWQWSGHAKRREPTNELRQRRNTTAQNIHLAKLLPINASGMDPCRKLSPANTRQMIAANGARSSISLMKSDNSCGGAIFRFREKKKGRRRVSPPRLPSTYF